MERIEKLMKQLREEMEGLRERIACGVAMEGHPYEYWVGQYLAHKWVVEEAERIIKRAKNPEFEDEENDYE